MRGFLVFLTQVAAGDIEAGTIYRLEFEDGAGLRCVSNLARCVQCAVMQKPPIAKRLRVWGGNSLFPPYVDRDGAVEGDDLSVIIKYNRCADVGKGWAVLAGRMQKNVFPDLEK